MILSDHVTGKQGWRFPLNIGRPPNLYSMLLMLGAGGFEVELDDFPLVSSGAGPPSAWPGANTPSFSWYW